MAYTPLTAKQKADRSLNRKVDYRIKKIINTMNPNISKTEFDTQRAMLLDRHSFKRRNKDGNIQISVTENSLKKVNKTLREINRKDFTKKNKTPIQQFKKVYGTANYARAYNNLKNANSIAKNFKGASISRIASFSGGLEAIFYDENKETLQEFANLGGRMVDPDLTPYQQKRKQELSDKIIDARSKYADVVNANLHQYDLDKQIVGVDTSAVSQVNRKVKTLTQAQRRYQQNLGIKRVTKSSVKSAFESFNKGRKATASSVVKSLIKKGKK